MKRGRLTTTTNLAYAAPRMDQHGDLEMATNGLSLFPIMKVDLRKTDVLTFIWPVEKRLAAGTWYAAVPSFALF